MASNFEFPSPVGGVPFPIDFAPAILFSVLFALSLPVFFWRMANPQTRHFVLIGTAAFSIEHVVNYALRAHTAHSAGARTSGSLETYFQTTLQGGFITMGQDLTNLTRALLVNATMGSEKTSSPSEALQADGQAKQTDSTEAIALATRKSAQVEVIESGTVTEDLPHMRARTRKAALVIQLSFWAATILSIVAGVDWQNTIKNGRNAQLVQQLRYASAAVCLLSLVGVMLLALWGCVFLPRVSRAATMWVILVGSLLSVVAIYRLAVMHFYTDSLTSTAPGSLNSSGSKASFFVLHVAPEYVAATILMSLNVRRIFNTGLWGDRRMSDPKPKEGSQ